MRLNRFSAWCLWRECGLEFLHGDAESRCGGLEVGRRRTECVEEFVDGDTQDFGRLGEVRPASTGTTCSWGTVPDPGRVLDSGVPVDTSEIDRVLVTTRSVRRGSI